MSWSPGQCLTGHRLGEFEVIRELGRGGMGVVYEAVQTSLGRRVALKVLGLQLGLTPKAIDRFRREAAAAAKLHHTNIVPIYATGEEGGLHYYAMELIDGSGLDLIIRQRRESANQAAAISPDLAATAAYTPPDSLAPLADPGSAAGSSTDWFDRIAVMIADVADALHHAHQNGVTHRDIKPSNLLLASDGRLSLTDFGLARMLEQPGMTVTGEFIGTPAYMSPEQITAGRVPVDHRTDIYSLGATLYELLTLCPPFVADGRDRLLAMVIQKEPMPPRSVNPKVPRDLETICLKCLEKDPDRRYPHAKALADDLRRYVNRFAILAKRTGPLDRLKKWVRRNPWVSGLAVAVLITAGVAGYFAWQVHETDRTLRARLLEQEQEAALEKAYLTAMSGDWDAAERQIAEAERLGAAPGEVAMIRGLLEIYRGGTPVRAVTHLEIATRHMPDSIAAQALLALAYAFNDQLEQWDLTYGKALQRTPTAPRDYLFLARCEALFDSHAAMRTLDKGGAPERSGLARIVRSEILALHALQTGRREDVEAAVAAAEAAVQFLGESPVTLANRIQARLAEAAAHEDRDDLAARSKTLDRVRADADLLAARFPKVPIAARARFDYFLFLDDDPGTLKEAEGLRLLSGAEMYDAFVANLYYRAGKPEKALEIVQSVRTPQPSPAINVIRAFLHVEREEFDKARHLYATMMVAPDYLAPTAIYAQVILRFMGRVDEAERECRKLLDKPQKSDRHRGGWYRKVLEYNAGVMTEAELLRHAEHSRWNRCEAHFFIGMNHLGRPGKEHRDKAVEHFDKAVRTRMYHYFDFDYGWSQTFLKKLRDHPEWPKWVDRRR